MSHEEFMFNLDFDLYPDKGINSKVVDLFRERVCSEHWSLTQNGEIIPMCFEGLPEINFVVNTRNKRTRWSLNLLPRFFANTLSRKEKSLWQIEVYFHLHKETDRIILVDDRVHLEQYYLFWKAQLASLRNLLLDVEKLKRLT